MNASKRVEAALDEVDRVGTANMSSVEQDFSCSVEETKAIVAEWETAMAELRAALRASEFVPRLEADGVANCLTGLVRSIAPEYDIRDCAGALLDYWDATGGEKDRELYGDVLARYEASP